MTALTTVYEEVDVAIQEFNTYVSSAMKTFSTVTDPDDDSGPFVYPDGW